jgi:hypothetical protein
MASQQKKHHTKKNSIVTQSVTRNDHDSLMKRLWPGVLLSGWRDSNPRPLRPERAYGVLTSINRCCGVLVSHRIGRSGVIP